MIKKELQYFRYPLFIFLLWLISPREVSAQFVSPPTLVSPQNGSTNLSAPVTLVWDHASGSTYRVQVATNSSFNNIIADESVGTDQFYVLNTLTSGTNYYWRVNATSLLFTSDWSSVWNFTAADGQALPSDPILSSPADGSTNQPTTIILNWNASENADRYWLQIATEQTFSDPEIGDSLITSTSKQINNLSPSTTFYWRVKGLNSAGSSNWSSVWNFTTVSSQIEPPQQPTLVSPADNSLDQPTNITFSWNASVNADHYSIQVATDETFSNMVYTNYQIVGTSQNVNGLATNTLYYWQVRAENAGGESQWSAQWNFTTSQQPVPGTPALTSPADGSKEQQTTLTLNWNSAANADYYNLQVAEDNLFNNIIYNSTGITSNSQQISGLGNGTKYYWRVNAENNIGVGSWSEVWNFTTHQIQSSPTPPTLGTPLNGSTGESLNPVLTWDSVSTADTYRLQVSSDQNFQDILLDDSTITNPTYTVGPLNSNTKYIWRVNAKNSIGTSSWSEVWNFTTGSEQTIPSSPTLISPKSGSADESIYPILSWDTVSTANVYRLQVADEISFNNIVYDDSTITVNYQQVGPLNQAVKYFWRVRAKNNVGISSWSAVWNFTTLNDGNFAPNLLSPDDGLNNLPLITLCVWDSVENSQLYEIEVSTEPDFSSIIIDETTNQTYKQLEGLSSYTTYFWRVRAKINNEWRQYCPSWRFTTRSSTPTYLEIDTTITFPFYDDLSKYKSSDYKIVGIPGAGHVPVLDFLHGVMKENWQAYWDNGKSTEYLVEYNESDFFYTIGKAFWIINQGDIKIDVTIENAPVNNNNNIEIPLHSGWNLITNPILSPVTWDTIKTINSINEPIYSFDNSYKVSQMFLPYKGFYFFNSTNITKLEVPSVVAIDTGNSINKKSSTDNNDYNWVVNIKLNTEEHSDSIAWFGVSSSVNNDYNYLDVHKPRSWGSVPEIYFLRPEWDKDYPAFASDIRPLFDDIEEWDFEITSTVWEPFSLIFNLEEVPDQFNVFLFNTASNKWTNLNENSSYEFTPATKNTSFKILVGKEAENNLTVSVPNEFELGNNYPNPFNLSTTIPVTIPEKSEIEINIFNVIGIKIKTIYKGSLEAGKHWFRWDGTDNKGNVTSSGVYFYRLSDFSKFSKTKKMIILK